MLLRKSLRSNSEQNFSGTATSLTRSNCGRDRFGAGVLGAVAVGGVGSRLSSPLIRSPSTMISDRSEEPDGGFGVPAGGLGEVVGGFGVVGEGPPSRSEERRVG